MEKRPIVRIGGGDIRALVNTMLYSSNTSTCWDCELQIALFSTLLYVTGARPGDYAYSAGHREDGHYLKHEVILYLSVLQDMK